MGVLRILFLFLNLAGSLILWTAQSPAFLDSTVQLASDSTSDLSIHQSSILELGEALPNSFVPERPVVRSAQYFFDSQLIPDNFPGLSAICQIQGLKYQRLAQGIDPSLPAFLIAFPHHYFT